MRGSSNQLWPDPAITAALAQPLLFPTPKMPHFAPSLFSSSSQMATAIAAFVCLQATSSPGVGLAIGGIPSRRIPNGSINGVEMRQRGVASSSL